MKPEKEKIFHPWYVQYVRFLPEIDKPPRELPQVLAAHEKILDILTERGMPPKYGKCSSRKSDRF